MHGTAVLLRDSFKAMGCRAVVETERADLLLRGRQRLEELESSWSRFVPESQIARLNAGSAVHVSADTAILLNAIGSAMTATDGACNPTVLPELLGAGAVRPGAPLAQGATTWARWPLGVVCGGDVVRLPGAMTLDPGAVGKGLAADLVAQELTAAGAGEVCVCVGGDLAFRGTPRPIDVLDTRGGVLARIAFRAGGVATSAGANREHGRPCHVWDPWAGRVVRGTLEQVSVVASSALWAEAIATACLVADGLEPAEKLGLGALALRRNGEITRSRAWRELRAGQVVADGAVTP